MSVSRVLRLTSAWRSAGPAVASSRLEPHVAGELEVGRPIADHVAVRLVKDAFLKVGLDEPRRGLAAGAALAGHVRADEDVVEVRALALEDLHHQVVRPLEMLPRE